MAFRQEAQTTRETDGSITKYVKISFSLAGFFSPTNGRRRLWKKKKVRETFDLSLQVVGCLFSNGPFLFLSPVLFLSHEHCSGVRQSVSASSSPRGVPSPPAAASAAAPTEHRAEIQMFNICCVEVTSVLWFTFYLHVIQLLLF